MNRGVLKNKQTFAGLPIKKTVLLALVFAAGLCAVWREDGLAQSSLLFVTTDYPPYVFCEKDAATGIDVARKGIDVDIISELFRRIGQPYSLQCLPWKRALNKVKEGEAAGLLVITLLVSFVTITVIYFNALRKAGLRRKLQKFGHFSGLFAIVSGS